MKTLLTVISLLAFSSNANAGVSGECRAKIQEFVSAFEGQYNAAGPECKKYLDSSAAAKKEDDKLWLPQSQRVSCATSKISLDRIQGRARTVCTVDCKDEPGVSQACSANATGLTDFLNAHKRLLGQ